VDKYILRGNLSWKIPLYGFILVGSIILGFLIPKFNPLIIIGILIGVFLLFWGGRYPVVILFLICFSIPLETFITIGDTSINRYLTIILLLVLCIYHLFGKRPFRLEKSIILFTGWICLALFSYLWSGNANRLSENFFGYALSWILLVAIVDLVNTPKKFSRILMACIAGMIVFIAIWLLSGETTQSGAFLPTGGAGSWSGYGKLLGAIVACTFAVIFFGKSPIRFFALAILFLLIALMILTGLRRTFFTSIVVIAAFFMFRRQAQFQQIALFVLIVVGSYLVWIFVFPTLDSNMQSRFVLEDVVLSGGTGRLTLFKLAYQAWLSAPVFGIGLGNFPLFASNYYEFAAETHNMYLEALAETGIVGFGLWMGGLFLIGRQVLAAYQKIDKIPNKLLVAVPFALFIYVLSAGLIGTFSNWRLLWLAFGMAIIAGKYSLAVIKEKQGIPKHW
jgi:O-antigen ligase